MYTIDVNYNSNFSSNTFIPVTPNTFVSSNSVNGTIDYVKVMSGGNNYQTYASGYLTSFVNNYVVQLGNEGSNYNNFYNGSSIYLRTGIGAGQLRQIISYNGFTKQVAVNTPFNSYEHLELTNIQGSNNITVGQTVTQRIDSIFVNYLNGYFNSGDVVLQSDTGATGTLISANSICLTVVKTSNVDFSLNYPVYNTAYAGNIKGGLVNITNNSVYVNAVSGTSFVSDYTAGSYIKVGSAANNIRKINAVNSTVITVDSIFNNTLLSNTHYSIPVVAEPSSITINNANGIISDTNLNGIQLFISNNSLLGVNYYSGEIVNLVDVNNVSQLANGIVSFANTTYVSLTNIQGTFTPNLYILGASSLQKSYISSVKSNPNITLISPSGAFVVGQNIYVRPTANISQQVANATLTASYYIPNDLSEYIISPTITITGDGSNALGYAIVNSVSNSISSIVVIDSGMNYNYANVSISANNLYGAGANLIAIVSPSLGHGYDAVKELGSRYIGITTNIDIPTNESFRYPVYGYYRRIGIIQDPLFNDVTVNVDTFDRLKASIANTNGIYFANSEIVLQPSTNAAGVVVTSNTTFIELKNVKGNFVSNANIYGLLSNASAYTTSVNTSIFRIGANVEIVSETSSGGTGSIAGVISNNTLQLTNVTGKFDANDTIIDYSSNTYANVVSIYTSNNTVQATNSFGEKFNQTARITLSSVSGTYANNETVIQTITNAYGKVLSYTGDLDISLTSVTGSFTFGDTITDTTSNASAYVIAANSTYLKLTGVSGIFNTNHYINNGRAYATISNTYNVVVLYDVSGANRFQTSTYPIVGQISGASGISKIANTISYPDLVNNSGKVLYVENVSPFGISNTSKEKISLVIKF